MGSNRLFSAIIASGLTLGASLGVTTLSSCGDGDDDGTPDAGFDQIADAGDGAEIDASVEPDAGFDQIADAGGGSEIDASVGVDADVEIDAAI